MSSCHCDGGWICEAHPDLCWPHGDCPRPGMQCDNPACSWWADGVPSATMVDESLVWPPEPLEPQKPFHERAWRLVGPSNRVLVCEIVGVTTGLEVHARYDGEADPVRTQLTAGLPDARLLAAQWREAALGLGSFLELDLDA